MQKFNAGTKLLGVLEQNSTLGTFIELQILTEVCWNAEIFGDPVKIFGTSFSK